MSAYQVIIGGAGFAGISAGKVLDENGLSNFTIMEASDRIGGRMYSVPFGTNNVTNLPYTVETGAHWLGGGFKNPMYRDIAGPEELATFGVSDFWYMYNRDGDFLEAETFFEEPSISLRLDNALSAAGDLARSCLLKGTDDAPLKQKEQQLCDTIRPNFVPSDDDDLPFEDLLALGGYNKAEEPDEAIANMIEVWYFGTDEGQDDLSKLSSTFYFSRDGTGTDFGGDSRLVTDLRGFHWLPKVVAASYLSTSIDTEEEKVVDDDRLRANTKVLRVGWDPEGIAPVEVETCKTLKMVPKDLTPVLYPCNGGSTSLMTGNEFISTFSTAVLKASVQEEQKGAPPEEWSEDIPRFDPPLSASIPGFADAMLASDLGHLHRVWMQFPIRFWPGEDGFLSAYSRDGISLGEVASHWQTLDVGKGTKFYPGSRILCADITGSRALQLANTSNAKIQKQMLKTLNSMFRKKIRRLYGGRRLKRSDILDFYVARWSNDPLFRGSWTYVPFGWTMENEAAVAAPRYGNLVFSGARSCLRFFGWTHGGQFSGERSARFLLKERYGMEDIDTFSICDSPAVSDDEEE